MKGAEEFAVTLRRLATLCRLTVIGLALSNMAACSSMYHPADSEYSLRTAVARTDCTGNEIVGVWVSKLTTNPLIDLRQTIMFKPDGSGRARIKTSPLNFGQVLEWDLRWRYVGGGKWEATAKRFGASQSTPPRRMEPSFSVQWTGNELLAEMRMRSPLGNTNTSQSIYVPADNASAVEAHLKSR